MKPIKNLIKRIVFNFVNSFLKLPFLKSYRQQLLRTWMNPEKRTRFENRYFELVLNAWFYCEYWNETNPDLRVIKQEQLMGGELGVAWAKYYNDQDFPPTDNPYGWNISFSEAMPVFDRLTELCRTKPNILAIQLSCSSGREIAWLAKQFPQHRFFGTDIFEDVVVFANSHHQSANLSFFSLAAHQIHHCLEILSNSEIVIFTSGSMQYVQPEHLQLFFKGCKSNKNKVHILLNEPGKSIVDEFSAKNASLPRGNFSYTHSYAYYAKIHQLTIVNALQIRPFKEKNDVVHHFFYCHN